MLAEALCALERVLNEHVSRPTPVFLSVVVRTQGRRQEQIQDALLCLSAQTDQDFEVIVIAHDTAKASLEEIESLVGMYPRHFSDRVSLIPVEGGGRSEPLALAVRYARGQYIAFYDDDDLIMADWVEAFRKGADAAPGQVIRAKAGVQENKVESWGDGVVGQRAVSGVHTPYPVHFSFLAHLERSYSPFMSLAFPIAFFRLWGEEIDLSLPVCEDWDLLLRAVTLVGISDVPELTAIYRRWNDSENSYNSHEMEVWDDAKLRLREKLDSVPAFFPKSTVTSTVEYLEEDLRHQLELAQAELVALRNSTSWRITAPLRALIRRLRRG